ncbi:MAG: four-carbon acid sugar kinase family protein [Armatimonadota bacterium]|nr:four-carbon acid sugar kinase family protein [Armatimonadota bacterium]
MHLAVIADDLTGACATGALLVPLGRVRVTLEYTAGRLRTVGGAPDALVVCTDSRAESPEVAAARTAAAATALRRLRPAVIGKRIDSTLRGWIGQEVRALLEVLPDRAVVVPAAPAAGRTAVGGVVRVGGTPLGRVEDAGGPAEDVTAHVPTLVARQSGMEVAHVPLETVRHGADAVRDVLAAYHGRIVVVDAETDADLARIARACDGLSVIPVDPGPFTAALARRRIPHAVGHGAVQPTAVRVLVLAGSPTPLVTRQVQALVRETGADVVHLDPARAGDGAHCSDVADRARAWLARAGVAIVRPAPADGSGGADAGRARPEAMASPSARVVARALGAIAGRVLEAGPPGVGLVVTGGDVALATCRALGARAIEILGEVFPLCAAGRLLYGRHEGTPIVTKGGMVGDDDGLVRAWRALREGWVPAWSP